MIKFMVMFRDGDTLAQFESAYNDFLGLVERMPDVKRRQVVHTLGSPQGKPSYYRILEVYFESQTDMQSSLMSPRGQEAGQELARFPIGTVDLMFAEVYEETGGSTPDYTTQNQ